MHALTASAFPALLFITFMWVIRFVRIAPKIVDSDLNIFIFSPTHLCSLSSLNLTNGLPLPSLLVKSNLIDDHSSSLDVEYQSIRTRDPSPGGGKDSNPSSPTSSVSTNKKKSASVPYTPFTITAATCLAGRCDNPAMLGGAISPGVRPVGGGKRPVGTRRPVGVGSVQNLKLYEWESSPHRSPSPSPKKEDKKGEKGRGVHPREMLPLTQEHDHYTRFSHSAKSFFKLPSFKSKDKQSVDSPSSSS
jgi:hypothetical protein